ncbi:MAG TPA: contact-dependent growth inhibition system immunity protein [Tepidisphaeraceae bacterium]|jgi:hypothetical protein
MLFGRIFNAKRWKPQNAAACAYLRKGKLLLHGSSVTQIGNLDCPPYQLLPGEISDEQLGAALLEILSIAKAAPPPSDLAAERQKLFATAKVRSWKQLNDGAAYCHIGMTPSEITLIPTRNEGQGFSHLPDQGITLPAACTPKQLGAAVRDGFCRCTSS